MHAGLKRRPGPLFGAVLVVGAVVATITPVVPGVAASGAQRAAQVVRLADASASPSDSASPAVGSPTPAPAPSDSPSAAPSGSPAPSAPASASPAPSDSASASPSPSDGASASALPSDPASPGPSGSASASPGPSDSTPPSGSPVPSSSAPASGSPVPSLTPCPSGGASASPSRAPCTSPTPPPVLRPLALVNPNSPHVISATGLTSDACAACHETHRAQESNLLGTTYRINPLRASGEAYRAADFGLCWKCHAPTEAAIEDPTGATAGTNFASHGFHLKSIGTFGSGGLDITVAGAGQGNALCAECHYNLHGVASAQQGLVQFAPDVVAYNGQPIVYDAATGSCTLTCHGVNHNGTTVPAP